MGVRTGGGVGTRKTETNWNWNSDGGQVRRRAQAGRRIGHGVSTLPPPLLLSSPYESNSFYETYEYYSKKEKNI